MLHQLSRPGALMTSPSLGSSRSNGSIVINAGVINLLLSSYGRDIHFLKCITAAQPPKTGITKEFSPKTRKNPGEFLLH